MFRVTTAVQQIMTELNSAVSEEEIVAITKIVLNLMKQMATRVHRPLNINGIRE
jgi:hypothetical protein